MFAPCKILGGTEGSNFRLDKGNWMDLLEGEE